MLYAYTTNTEWVDMIYQRIPMEDLATIVYDSFRAHHHTDPWVRMTKIKAVVCHLKEVGGRGN